MVNILKLEEPQILKDNAEKWTEEYLACISAGGIIPERVAKRYNHPEIRLQLLKETHGKCAYCESKFSHIEPGDIEHIKPKKADAHPELYVTWSNLTMSCETCNRSGKKDYNNDAEPLLNPYADSIDAELVGSGPMLFAKGKRGRITIDVLKLNRSELLAQRVERLKSIDLLRQKYEEETNASYKQVLLEEIRDEISCDKEYSFILKSYLIQMGLL